MVFSKNKGFGNTNHTVFSVLCFLEQVTVLKNRNETASIFFLKLKSIVEYTSEQGFSSKFREPTVAEFVSLNVLWWRDFPKFQGNGGVVGLGG